jgi:hypothetical protein
MSEDTLKRIHDLHAWYQRNVLPMRLTPEVERLWWEWFKAGYNGPDLRDVIRYIRRQISLGKRNEGALKLSNLLARTECGFMKFDEDLALSRARANLSVDKRLEALPGELRASAPRGIRPAPAAGPRMTDSQRLRYLAELKGLKR